MLPVVMPQIFELSAGEDGQKRKQEKYMSEELFGELMQSLDQAMRYSQGEQINAHDESPCVAWADVEERDYRTARAAQLFSGSIRPFAQTSALNPTGLGAGAIEQLLCSRFAIQAFLYRQSLSGTSYCDGEKGGSLTMQGNDN